MLSVEGMDFVGQTIRDLNITSADPKHGLISVQRYEDAAALQAEVAETKEISTTTLNICRVMKFNPY